ncbi:adenylyltransferase/cytidyltransferase family protein [archaeon]|nr:adenylyltransferase/cytidyltransferase family protein [archaeon]
MIKDLGIVAHVARFKPMHKGHQVVLESLCERADHVYIGLGSTNKYNYKNPFTAKESREMIDLILKPKYSNYSFIEVPDLDNGPRWKEQAVNLFGKLDHFVTANDYVDDLLKEHYDLLHTLQVIPLDKRIRVNATMVRYAIACGESWEHLVPEEIVKYIKEKKLDERLIKEFGLEIIARYDQGSK